MDHEQDEDAALQQYIWVSTNTPGGWGPDDDETPIPGPSGAKVDPDPTKASSSGTTSEPTIKTEEPAPPPPPPRPRRRRIKQCRICLDTSIDDVVDPESGRMISPCLCKGSTKYVHEECLRQWRLMSANDQSFYKCPTCKFEYRFSRLKVAQAIASNALQISITVAILIITVYILGFIADPIINMYINPWYAIEGGNTSFSVNGFTIYGPAVRGRSRAPIVNTDGKVGLLEHMMRGLSALGLIGFGKVLLFSHHWIRYVFGGGPVGLNRGRGDGRDRIGQLSWIIIIWGVVNFLIFVWGAVRTVTKRILDKIAIGVADIGGDDEEDEINEGLKEE